MLVISRSTLLATLVGMLTISSAHAFVTLGHGRLVGSTLARADYDSNIFVSNRQVEDMVGTLTGEVRYIRDAGIVSLEAAAGASWLGFAEHSELNSFDPHLEARLGYEPSDKTDARAGLTFRRNSIGNETVNARTESNDFNLDGSLDHVTTGKIGLRLTGAYVMSNYLTAGYSDIESYSAGAHALYEYSPKLKLLAGITTLESWTDSAVVGRAGIDTRDWRYTVGAEGEFAPKITGGVSAGVVQRHFKKAGFDDTGSFYFSGQVTWTASEKTSWSAIASEDLSVTAADQSARTSSLTLSLNRQLVEKLSFSGSIGADRSTYTGFNGIGARKDDGYTARARVDYTLRDNASFDVSAGYRDNDSTIAISDYDRFNFGAGITVRF